MTGDLKGLGLRIVHAPNAGFCYGVQRAFDMAQAAADRPGPKYTLGPLIHNAAVVNQLRTKGLEPLADETALAGLSEGETVVIRSHGVPRHVVEEGMAKGLRVVDATCPYVRRAQMAAEELVNEGYTVVIVGDMGHPEVIGILGTIKGKGILVSGPEDLPPPEPQRYGVIAQTTQSLENLKGVVDKLLECARELRVINTICTATRARQDGVREIAPNVDAMLVVGDPGSANTKRLAQISQECGVRTHLIQSADELRVEWFVKGDRVGVTAGASTPSWIIEEVIDSMQDSNEEKNDALTEAPEVKPVAPERDFLTMAEAVAYEESFKDMRVGDIVRATVVGVMQDEVLVDVGYKSEGTVPLKELTHRRVDSAKELVKVGDAFDAKIIHIDHRDDSMTLSKKQADQNKYWDSLKEAFEAGMRIKGTIDSAVKGGLTADIGVRGFIPASQVDRGFVSDLGKYVGVESEFYITEMDDRRKNVVLSRRRVVEEEQAKSKTSAYDNLVVGSVVDGEVKRLTAFGAFVDIGGGVEGLLHISELSWGRPKHPSEVLKEGESIKVMILGVDKERERISLGLKQVLGNPWANITEKYPIGSTVRGIVGNLANFGAFVKLEDGVDGLIHISQLSHDRITNPAQAVLPGQEVIVRIVDINEDAKRISLSLKDLQPLPGEDGVDGDYSRYAGDDQGGATIGEILGSEAPEGSKDGE